MTISDVGMIRALSIKLRALGFWFLFPSKGLRLGRSRMTKFIKFNQLSNQLEQGVNDMPKT